MIAVGIDRGCANKICEGEQCAALNGTESVAMLFFHDHFTFGGTVADLCDLHFISGAEKVILIEKIF